jgi:hypothetical protein
VSYRLLCSSLLIFGFSTYALATETNNTIESQFKAALLCNVAPIDGRDAKVVKQLSEQNITVKNLEEDGLINLEYHFAKPLEIMNTTVSQIKYQGDSGSYFYAIAKGDIDTFAKSMAAIPIPADLKEEMSWGDIGQYYQYTAPVTEENPFPSIILIGRDKNVKSDEFYFGCEEFDS